MDPSAEPLQRRESWGCPWALRHRRDTSKSSMARTLALLAAPLAARAVSCPAGPDEAPRTALTVKFPRHSCETVRNEFTARMAMDPSYRVTAEASDSLTAARTTDTTHDVFAFAYEATVQDQRQGSPKARVAGCVVRACGVKLYSGDEEGELYCSMRDLYCGRREDCVPLLDFGDYFERITERSKSRTDAGRCVGGAQPAFDGSVHRYNDQRGVSGCVEINQCVGAPDHSSLSHFGDDAAVLARSSGEDPASPRHR